MNRRNTIIAGLAGLTAVATLTPNVKAEEAKTDNPELDAIRAVLKAHDDAMTNHDLKGVMAGLSPKAVIVGTGPGEVWSTPEEIKEAYEHFFTGYDKGEQEFVYHFKRGGLSADMGWLMASGEIKGKKDGKAFGFPMNVSLTASKAGGTWQIVGMHFSTLTGEGSQK